MASYAQCVRNFWERRIEIGHLKRASDRENFIASSTPNSTAMNSLKVQRRAHRAPADRMLERYPMSNSELYSSDISSDEDISDLVYRNLRFKTPTGQPHQPNGFGNLCAPQQSPFEARSHIRNSCAKCNRIRTNPRFRPSSFHCYGQLQRVFVSDENSSEDHLQSNQTSSISSHRRRARLKSNSR